jgi:hypothetical protein
MPGGTPLQKNEKTAPALHSRYNPQGEAERYIDSLKPGGIVKYFILIEPGLGYLVPALQKRYPGAALIALHLDRAFESAARAAGIPAWFPGDGPGPQQFLEDQIPDTEARFIRIIEWRPGLRVYGEKYLRILEEAANFIKRIDANARTTRNFGKRWLKNFLKNLRLLDFPLKPEPFDRPLVITGSGPSLEAVIPLIGDLKKTAPLFVLAASSSVRALAWGGIVPDLVFSADGGGWALRHLYECFRLSKRDGPPPPLAANLCAALPSQCAALPMVALNDGSLWQRMVLRGLGIPSLTVPPRGTVSAAALDLALILNRGNICIAGLDLSIRDIRTHVKPYGFDSLLWEGAFRLDPFYAKSFRRAEGIREGGSHRIYAAWFQKQVAAWPDRIFSLGNNNSVFQRLKSWDKTGGQTAVRGNTQESGLLGEPMPVPPGERSARGAEILARALLDPGPAAALTAELAPLLFPHDPGQTEAAPGELAEELRALARPYAEGRRG